MQPFTINNLISLEDYRYIVLRKTFKRPVTILLTVFGLAAIVINILSELKMVDGPITNLFGWPYMLFPFVVVAMAFYRAKVGYNSSARLKNGIDYTFSETELRAKAVDSEWAYQWGAIVKTEEMGKYLLVYSSKTNFELLLKEKMTEDQLNFIRVKTGKYSI
ncbi:MAG TPA: hypothetical protein VNS58_30115 [Puia sp.]|nr:hypothetical protein [Puia sp.]